MKFITLILFLIVSSAGADETASNSTTSRSVGDTVNDESIDLLQQLSSSPLLQDFGPSKARSDDSAMIASNLQYRLSAPQQYIQFEIYDAWVELSGDLDYDGYHHRIRTRFDADVNSPAETVYAKLYLSHQGGRWIQLTESDLFEIHYDAEDDSYEFVSELVSGYPPGYYDVLIEIHSLFHPDVVASRVLYSDDAGYAIALEDLDHDQPYQEQYVVESYVYGAGGSFSWAGLILLGMLLIIKLRYFRRST